MMTSFELSGQSSYSIADIESIRTPRLLVFQDRVQRNIIHMREVLERIAPDSGFHHLWPHTKTHKSSVILSQMMQAGINSFKTTLNEAELAARSGTAEVFIAYPLLTHDAAWVANLMDKYPETQFYIQVGSQAHAEILRKCREQTGGMWHYFIDLDVGMHRTGIAPKDAWDLYQILADQPDFAFAGLHGYDGHNHHAEPADRRAESERSMARLVEVFRTFTAHGAKVERTVAAGSISFLDDLEILLSEIGAETRVQVSPGNWIYWDSEYDKLIPGRFEIAALVLAQVIEVEESRITLNLGHKRWGADRGPVERFSPESLEVVSFNEEHTMLKSFSSRSWRVGDYVLIVPRHACSTVNLYGHFVLLKKDGRIMQIDAPVDGRNI